jgi:Pilin (bacterial filament)
VGGLRCFGSGHKGELSDRAVVLTASYDAGSRRVVWVCGGTPDTTVPEAYLPAGCKPR